MGKQKGSKQPVSKKPRLEQIPHPVFASAKAEEHYDKYLTKRTFFFEKGFKMSDATDMGLQAMVHSVITAHRWQQFCRHPDTVVIPLVREFCANMEKENQLAVNVRGVMVPISPSDINAVYGFGAVEVEDHYFSLVRAPIEAFLKEVLARVCLPNTNWDVSPTGRLSIHCSRLQPDAKVWFHFLQTRLLPTSHLYTISRDRAILLFCVLEGRPLDVGRIIYSELYLCASLDTISCRICFPALISALCLKNKVPYSDWEEQVKVPGAITRHTVDRLLREKGAAAAPLVDEERLEHFPSSSHAQPSSTAAGTSSGNADTATLLLQRFDQFEKTQQARLDQLEKNQQLLMQLVQHLEQTSRDMRQYIKDRDVASEKNIRNNSKKFFSFPTFPESVLQDPPHSPAAAPVTASSPTSDDHHSEGTD